MNYWWEQNNPDETYVSKQKLRDNIAKIKKKVDMNGDSVTEAEKEIENRKEDRKTWLSGRIQQL